MAGRNAGKGSPTGVLSLAGSSPNDSVGSDSSSAPSSGIRAGSDAASVPGYAEVRGCSMTDMRSGGSPVSSPSLLLCDGSSTVCTAAPIVWGRTLEA